VFGLGQQIGRHDERVGRIVGDDQHLGRPGEQVDTHLAEELPLCLCDVSVAGAREHVDSVDRFRTQSQGRDGLDAAHDVDLVCAGEAHRRNADRRRRANVRRSRGGDPRNTRNFGRQHGHMG
jgi:hypothetical protein